MSAARPLTIAVDPEAARIMSALKFGAGAILVYFASKQLDREQGGAGWVEIAALHQMLRSGGLKFAARTLQRWIARGAGVLWDVDKASGRLYLYQLTRQTARGLRGRLNLTQLALDAARPELVTTNPPGARYVEVEAATGQQFTANLYAAWLSSRIKPDRLQTFSRYTLTKLWGVTRNLLMKWEQRAGIEPVRAITQYDLDPDVVEVIPPHAEPYAVRAGEAVVFRAFAWHSNLFSRPDAATRSHSRLPRERRKAAAVTLEFNRTPDPAFSKAGSGIDSAGQLDFTGRLHFFDSKGKRYTPAGKRVYQHLRKHQDHDRAHYAHVGIDRKGRHVFEATQGRLFTWLDEALPRVKADSHFKSVGGRHAVASIWRSA